jgi:serine/threonine protein phosphatase PrpC
VYTGGTKASDFAEEHMWPNFNAALQETGDVAAAFKSSYVKTDEDYIKTGRERQDPSMLLTGTCAVGAYVDLAQRKVTVGNLGDSRAVLGVYSDGFVQAIDMSTDHSATTDAEKYRLRNENPMDADIIVEQFDEWKEDYDCVVKSVTRFTRSIGDAHMKDKTCAKLFNSYRCGVSIDPLPRKNPYISNQAEIKEREVENGFIIIACDGIWDEMSSDEAVHLCSHLMTKHSGQPDANIADLFLNETLKKATARLRRTDPDEGELTLEDLKSRPLGKQGRSQLHDDLTCVILSWRSTAAKMKLAGGAGGGGWGSIKKAVDMHREIKHRKKLKWARLMDDMMLMVRQEREGQPSTLTAQILSEADDPDDEESEDRAQAEQDKAAALKLIGEGGVDFTRAVASAAEAAEAAAKAATSADLVGRTGDPEVMRACAMAANAAAAAANQATAAAGAAAAAATSAAMACEAMARACGVDITAATAAHAQEAKD